MIVVNFSHPITDEQRSQIETLMRVPVEQIINVAVHFDTAQSFAPQLQALMDQIPLDAETWQNALILVNPPSLNYIAAMLMAELYGRMGYFPPIIRLRPLNTVPPRYEVAEILNLNAVRGAARARRTSMQENL